MNTKRQLKTGKILYIRIILGIILVIIGVTYIVIDIVDRYQSAHILGLFSYKPIIISFRDCIFASSAIIGGGLLFPKNKYAWYFILFFALGNTVTSLFEVLIPIVYRTSMFNKFVISCLVSTAILFLFTRKNFLATKGIYVPVNMCFIIAIISLSIVVVNICIMNYIH